ncbi:uncharacterized protein [Elaeis guineensis]|uniref:Uncharacterized protein LOC114913087 n=1 Tax=Elaeis guineensis var. tenera TaxID=51953 RepID=A0A8N4IB08_ELAGV|nr:uncharacterized protein LOC114913087 [Elaeis guineensis]
MLRIYAQDVKLSNNTVDARRLEEQKKEIMEEHRKELENLRRKIETKMESMEKSYGEKMGKIETQLSHITSLLEKVSQPQASGTSESHGDDPDKPSEGQKL